MFLHYDYNYANILCIKEEKKMYRNSTNLKRTKK